MVICYIYVNIACAHEQNCSVYKGKLVRFQEWSSVDFVKFLLYQYDVLVEWGLLNSLLITVWFIYDEKYVQAGDLIPA